MKSTVILVSAIGGLTGEKVMEINKKFNTNFLSAH
jgi:hypothetical protein